MKIKSKLTKYSEKTPMIINWEHVSSFYHLQKTHGPVNMEAKYVVQRENKKVKQYNTVNFLFM